MRKVKLQVAVSLDGLIEGPNGEYDWCFTDQDYGMKDFLMTVDAIFMGRKTYALAQSMGGENPWKGITTYVFSNTLNEVKGKDTLLVCGDIAPKVASIRKENGKDIWLFGGASLTASLMNEGLVDELHLAVHPILLGQGKPLFHGIHKRIKAKLVDTRKYDSGLLMMSYQVVNEWSNQ